MTDEHSEICNCSETIFDACGSFDCMQCIRRFLNEDADILQIRDDRENSLLHQAVVWYNQEIVEWLIQRGVSPNIKNTYGETPMHIITYGDVDKNNIDIYVILIKNGGDINAKDENGATPLNLAILYECWSSAAFLIENGANLDEKDNNNNTPLHMATRHRHMNRDVMELLIRSGANPYEKNVGGKTFLELMVESERKYFMDLINEQECFHVKTPCE